MNKDAIDEISDINEKMRKEMYHIQPYNKNAHVGGTKRRKPNMWHRLQKYLNFPNNSIKY